MTGEDELMRQACADIIGDLIQHPRSRPFRKQVGGKKLGLNDQALLMSKAMDFGTISNNVRRNAYTAKAGKFDYRAFEVDVRLVFQNCRTYYQKGSDNYNSGLILEKQFAKAWGVFIRRFRPDEVDESAEDGYDSDDSYQPPPDLPKRRSSTRSGGLASAFRKFGSKFRLSGRQTNQGTVDQEYSRSGSLSSFAQLSAKAREQFRESIQTRATNQRRAPAMSPQSVAAVFDKQERITKDQAVNLVTRVTDICSAEPNVLDISALDHPAILIGDLHGQYWDMRHMLRVSQQGTPSAEEASVLNGETSRSPETLDEEQQHALDFAPTPGTTYLFLGDYVDRGAFSCEILLYLFALKVAYPDQIYLVRGNHECDAVASYFGFKRECDRKYGRQVYNAAIAAFCTMPIAATLRTRAGTLLCCHGGLSPNIDNLDALRRVNRFQEPGVSGPLCDVLWSDPVKDDDMISFVNEEDNEKEKAVFRGIDYFRNSTRGCSYRYGFRATDEFLVKNNLVGLIRAHEVQEQGFRYHFNQIQQKGVSWERVVVTVFSAPNYCERYQNRAAFLRVNTSAKRGSKTTLAPIAPSSKSKKQTRRMKLGRRKDKKQGRNSKARSLQPEPPKRGSRYRISQLLQVVQFDAVPHPVPATVPNATYQLFEMIEKNCPYMPSTSSGFLLCAMALGKEYGDAHSRHVSKGDTAEFEKKRNSKSRPKGPSKEASLREAKTKLKRAYLKISVMSMLKKLAISAFEVAKVSDELNEKHPMLLEDIMEDVSKRFLEKQESKKRLGLGAKASSVVKDRLRKSTKYEELFEQAALDSRQPRHSVLERYADLVLEAVESAGGRERSVSEVNNSTLNAAVVSNLLEDLALWLTEATGYQVPATQEGFNEALRDGVVICRLLEQLPRNGIQNYHKDRPLTEFRARENLLEARQACDRLRIIFTVRPHDTGNDATGAYVSTLVNILHYVNNLEPGELQADSKSAPSQSPIKAAAEGGRRATTGPQRLRKSWAQHHPQSPQRPDTQASVRKQRPNLLSFRRPKPQGLQSTDSESEHRQASAKMMRELSEASLAEITPIENGVVSFSERELMALELLFLLVDSNSDGMIEANELVNWSREDPSPTSKAKATECIKAVDADGDGMIGQDDFLNFAAQLKELWLLDEAERAELKGEESVVGT